MGGPIELHFDSDVARRGAELARALITARAESAGDHTQLWGELLAEVVNRPRRELVAVVAALSGMAFHFLEVEVARRAREADEASSTDDEHLDAVRALLAQHFVFMLANDWTW